jgi:hypothetical protein
MAPTTVKGKQASKVGHTIQEEGGSLTQRTKLNFVGTAVTASDDAGNDTTIVTITATVPASMKVFMALNFR